MMLRPLIISLAYVPLILSYASAAQFLNFTTRSLNDGVAVYGNGILVCRTRGTVPHSFRPSEVAQRLTSATLNGITPEQVKVIASKDTAKLMAGLQLVLVVDKATAKAAQNTPGSLAATWASSLRKLLTTPYVVLDPADQLLVPVGERRDVRYGGTAARSVKFTSLAPDVVSLEVDTGKRTATVLARTKGTTVVSASLPDNTAHLLTIEAKYWAAYIRGSVLAEVSAPPLPADDMRRVIRNAALSAMQPRPEAKVRLGEPVPRSGAYAITVRAEGPDLLPTEQEVQVGVKAISPPSTPSRQLLVSNVPERIAGPSTLLRESLSGIGAVRLLWHHVNDYDKALRYVVRVANLSNEPARLHVIDAITGPGSDEIYIGHTAMVRFFQLWGQGEGYILTVPGGCFLDLYDVSLPPRLITSGLASIVPLEPRNLLLEVVAENSWPASAYFTPVPPALLADPVFTAFRFEAEKDIRLIHEARGAWTFYHIGKDYSQNLQGEKLLGDYGVYYRLVANFRNPTAASARCEIALRASGGVARAVILVDGQLVETGLLQGAREQVIHRLDLAPNEERTVQLRTIPQSGSNYPITLVMRTLR